MEKGSYVALYSPPQASELLYFCKVLSYETATTLSHLCKVLSCETPTTSISDANNYTVLQGIKYIRVHHLEKVKEKKEPCPL